MKDSLKNVGGLSEVRSYDGGSMDINSLLDGGISSENVGDKSKAAYRSGMATMFGSHARFFQRIQHSYEFGLLEGA